MEVAAGVALAIECVESVIIRLKLPRAILHAQEVVYGGTWNRSGRADKRICEINDLRVSTVVGLHPHERGERQRLEVDLGVRFDDAFAEWDHKAFQDTAMAVSLCFPLPSASSTHMTNDVEAMDRGYKVDTVLMIVPREIIRWNTRAPNPRPILTPASFPPTFNTGCNNP